MIYYARYLSFLAGACISGGALKHRTEPILVGVALLLMALFAALASRMSWGRNAKP